MTNEPYPTPEEQIDFAMEAVRQQTKRDRATIPGGKVPMDAETRAAWEKHYRDYKAFTCRVVIETNGFRSDELAKYLHEHLAQLERVEPVINDLPGQLNPFITRPYDESVLKYIPNARAPFCVILARTELLTGEDSGERNVPCPVVKVGVTIVRPDPFISLLQHMQVMDSTSLYDFARHVAEYINQHPRYGILAFLRDRDDINESVIEGMRQKFEMPVD